ncbi:heavy metal translocating P-type ATPase [Roseimaritima ulvae]|uniref:P-type Zn(2+) transporter n=1 Tax=Roseimaritima ulvae TaxID=980254 RepID=A0A5B9QQZ0_9BACT|nr:heavy metal translocating P-type ATPase [Roseimaritima ulvae]QEG41527.1 putative cadmium-transporting ATPase [Roseimaritima ulvae]
MTQAIEKTRFTIRLLVPGVHSPDDRCTERFIDLIAAKRGVDAAHVVTNGSEQTGEFCVHYDPDVLSLADVRDLAGRVGMDLGQRYGHWYAEMEPMHAGRASAVETRLASVSGVLEAVVSPDGAVRVEYDRQQTGEQDIDRSLDQILDHWRPDGEAAKPCCHGHHDKPGLFGRQTELLFACLCGVCLLVGWLLASFTAVSATVAIGFYLAAFFFGGFYTAREAFEKLRGGAFEIDFLMLVAAAGAAALDAWAEGALLLFLFSLGHSLEGYAMGRAKRAIEALAELTPSTARVRRDGREQEVSVDALQVGDVVVVKPDERVAADGFVIAGQSSVDQAPITGESMPVDKHPVTDRKAAADNAELLAAEHRVYAGTINQAGAIEIQVTKTAAENTLARVITMVNEAETRVSPTQKFTKRFQRVFVPTVLATVVLLLFAPLVLQESFGESFYRAMAVLVASSPCALAISTPSAVLSGVARAARGGILIKGGGPLESLGQLDAIAFDKTGTLTEGRPKITDIQPAEGVEESELLRIAVAVESLSNHPLAQAVVRDGRTRLDALSTGQSLPTAQNLQSITGRGVQADVEAQTVLLGNEQLFAEVDGPQLPAALRNAVNTLESDGRTTMVVRYGDRFLGVIGLMDTPRDAASRTIARLRKLGIDRMIMISGDNQQVANAVAAAVGIDTALGELMPEDKVNEIKKLNRQSGVAMVGDGVNDAPAMASAAVGIAMGAAGSDVALETADVALMADELDHLPLAIGLSRATSRIIRQNLWISLGMVVFLVPATILGLNIGPAVVLHEGSTLLVVCNALRLLAYKP